MVEYGQFEHDDFEYVLYFFLSPTVFSETDFEIFIDIHQIPTFHIAINYTKLTKI